MLLSSQAALERINNGRGENSSAYTYVYRWNSGRPAMRFPSHLPRQAILDPKLMARG